jgi:hypothetical protein
LFPFLSTASNLNFFPHPLGGLSGQISGKYNETPIGVSTLNTYSILISYVPIPRTTPMSQFNGKTKSFLYSYVGLP